MLKLLRADAPKPLPLTFRPQPEVIWLDGQVYSVIVLDGQVYINLENERAVRRRIDCDVSNFQETGQPIFAIEALMLARHRGICPPESIIEWIVDGFAEWWEAQGTRSLDEFLGLKRRPGQDPPFKVGLLQERNDQLFSTLALLQCLGVTLEKAAEMVCRIGEEKDWNKSRWKLGTIQVEHLMKIYKTWPERERYKKFLKEVILPHWNPEQRRDYLARFPADSVLLRARE